MAMRLKIQFFTAKKNPCGKFDVNELTAKAVYRKIDELMREFRAKSALVMDSSGRPMFDYQRDKALVK